MAEELELDDTHTEYMKTHYDISMKNNLFI